MKSYTNEDIIKYSSEVLSMAGLLSKLGLRPTGGNYDSMKRKLAILELDCSHWTGQLWNKNRRMKDWKDYSSHSNSKLKPQLIKVRGNKCECCGLTEWMGKLIKLELHHKDGNRQNNNEENLELICPNCHSFTPNFRNLKRNK